ncbi:MAG TPA: hypothetical protein VGB89_01600 [Bacteroidota bacterium]|jgi:hypothetical protein
MKQERMPMHCNKCDMDMNFHAEKIDYATMERKKKAEEPVIEIHTCPGCGDTATREAQ